MSDAMKPLPALFLALLAACGTASAPPGEREPPFATQTTVATTGLDSARMQAAIAEARSLAPLNAMIVMRDGETLYESTFNDGPPLSRAVNIKSASKSVLSALVGIAIERGVLEGVDQRVVEVLGPEAAANSDPRINGLTVGHLLSMQAGLERTSGANYGAWVSSSNWVRDALSRPFVADPGERMQYSTGSSHILSAMLTRASGRSMLELAREWLGEPLGITIPEWPADPQGIYFGGNDMRLTPRDLARFGELYRLGGAIDGERIVPAAWIDESWTPRTRSPWSGESYGYNWFLSQAGDYAVNYGWGYGGQMVFVVPELDLTVVMTSDIDVERGSDHIGDLRALLRDYIVPAAAAGGDFAQS
ncbi:MAG: beta-lactamase family protein [Erythrobacter sp.]|nr:beta-lactamase family protein [Erythrobacter sp.]